MLSLLEHESMVSQNLADRKRKEGSGRNISENHQRQRHPALEPPLPRQKVSNSARPNNRVNQTARTAAA